MTAWVVVVAVAAGSYALRVSMFLFLGGKEMPRWTHAPMALVGPAALGALTASVIFVSGASSRAVPLPELLAIVAGFVAVRRTSNVMHAFTVGLPVLWIASLVATV